MPISQALLPEFDHEMANTRKTLERVPGDKLEWRPHEKSFSFRDMTTHLANLPHWVVVTIKDDSLDMHPPGGEPVKAKPVESVEEALATFDANVAEARAALAGADDETLMGNWSLLNGGETIFTMPRVATLRSFVFNHMIHHRGQLTIYLRLNDVPLPALYGPSADEGIS